MAGHANAAPAIIKRKKNVVDGGHHGGAWKIAYADFVTAMMAFFMLMWLLSATTKEQRVGIADYFNPTIATNRTASGGDGLFGGDSLLKDKTLAQTGTGEAAGAIENSDAAAADAAQDADLKRLQSVLEGKGGESQTMERLLSHVVTKVTDEGLVIEVFDAADSPLFENDSAVPTETLTAISALLSDVMAMTSNKVAVDGYVRTYPVTLIKNPTWDLSAARAQAMRQLLEQSGLDQDRIARISGHADRKLATANPMAARNNRLEVILLRQDR
jgi:chemotaxis protein MotB